MTAAPSGAWIERSAGALLPIFSLPGGQLGPEALKFIDWLDAAGLRVWQMLPVGPVDEYGNPFASASAVAGHTGLLAAADLAAAPDPVAYARFLASERDWLDDWSLFVALKDECAGLPWWQWPPALREREPAALAAARLRLAARIEAECLAQFAFATAWKTLKQAANARGIRLFGDVPLFVVHDSADVWAHRELFEIDVEGRCEAVVGVPPDAFSADGQRWGFPPYRWAAMAAENFAWWRRRFEVQARRFDLVRLDHFRGFAAWWRIPADAPSAAGGRWVPGPGRAALDALVPVLKGVQLVAEDLGVITEDVVALRQALGLPGMRVLQFAFDGLPGNPHLPERHTEDCVCYTGTHDNDTSLGWWQRAPQWMRDKLQALVQQTDPPMPQTLVELAWASVAPLAVVPMQDLLGLDTRARMNLPGVAAGNWRWRLQETQLERPLAMALRASLLRHQRIPGADTMDAA